MAPICAERFTSIEVNARFTVCIRKARLKNGGTKRRTDSVCHQRASLRHAQQKLIDVEEPVIRCRDAASPLGNRLVAVVWQLPSIF